MCLCWLRGSRCASWGDDRVLFRGPGAVCSVPCLDRPGVRRRTGGPCRRKTITDHARSIGGVALIVWIPLRKMGRCLYSMAFAK